eukprot:1992122-Pleurochrysis_carterae.AAC.2
MARAGVAIGAESTRGCAGAGSVPAGDVTGGRMQPSCDKSEKRRGGAFAGVEEHVVGGGVEVRNEASAA